MSGILAMCLADRNTLQFVFFYAIEGEGEGEGEGVGEGEIT